MENYCALYGQDPLVALNVADIRSGAASIFTQVEEKWGLKLEPRVVPIEALGVDHVAR
jgi:uncharacterized protein (TIGR03435 family)